MLRVNGDPGAAFIEMPNEGLEIGFPDLPKAAVDFLAAAMALRSRDTSRILVVGQR